MFPKKKINLENILPNTDFKSFDVKVAAWGNSDKPTFEVQFYWPNGVLYKGEQSHFVTFYGLSKSECNRFMNAAVPILRKNAAKQKPMESPF